MVVTLKGMRSQTLSDLLAQFPSDEHGPLYEDLPCEEICSIKTKECSLAFDGSLTHQGQGGCRGREGGGGGVGGRERGEEGGDGKGAGVLVYDPDRH